MMKTTLREIRSHEPCSDGWRKLIKNLGTSEPDTEVTILQILESNGVEDAFWALRTQKYEDYCLILADVAESVAHHSDDPRVKDCIKAIRDYKAGLIDGGQLKAAVRAARAAWAAAAEATGAGATGAAWAAETAWAAADWAAGEDAAAGDTGAAWAAETAWAAADWAAGEAAEQWIINEKILKGYLCED